MNLSDIKKQIEDKLHFFVKYNRKDNTLMVIRSFYLRHGQTAGKIANEIITAFPQLTVLGSGEHWHRFVGSAKTGSAQDSFFWVKLGLKS